MLKHHSSKDYIIQKELGRGSFGVAYLSLQVSTQTHVVLKRINIGHLHPKYQQVALREVEILKKLDHPNIIKYYCSFIEDSTLSIITEYAEGGDLYQLLLKHRHRKTNFQESELWRILKELSSALNYLHKSNIIHRDIKCQNVFLTKFHTVKLGDLGASRLMTANMQVTRVGTPLYLSPEMIKQQPYDYKIDIWGLGCILYTLASHDAPFLGSNLITLGMSIINRTPKPLPGIYSRKLNNLVLLLLEKKPEDRPDISQVIQAAFGDKYEIEDFPTSYSLAAHYEGEVAALKVVRISRPIPMPGIANEICPGKPIFRQKFSGRNSPSSYFRIKTEISEETYERISRKKSRGLNTYRSIPEIQLDTPRDAWNNQQLRPTTTYGEENKQLFLRPSTAKPSLRTIIRSNTVVKINNYLGPAKNSKLKITVNDLLQYQINNKK